MNRRINNATICVGVGLICLIVSAMPMKSLGEVQFEPYASLRMYAGFKNDSRGAGGDNDLDVQIDMIGISRFGCDLAVDDRLYGNIEIAIKNTITLRKAYVIYKFDSFELLMGQDWTPNAFSSNEISNDDNGNDGFGATDDFRKKQFKITSSGGVYLCVLKPTLEPDIGAFDSGTVESTVPEVIVGYEYSGGAINLGLGVGYQTYELDDGTGAGLDGEAISSTIGFLHGMIDAGTVSVLFNMGGGINFGNLDVAGGRLNWKAQSDTGNGIEDTTCFEGFVEVDVKLFESVLRIGSGYAQAENSIWEETDRQWQAYANVEVPIYKSFTLTPEFSYRDYMDDVSGNDQGTEWWAGAKFQVDFR